jgi:hypothetical protein
MVALGTGLDARPDTTGPLPVEPAAPDVRPPWWRRNWQVLALGAGAVVMALASHYLIYPAFSWNRDEVTYLWQVDGLRAGNVFMADGGAPQFFWPWLAGFRHGGFFAQYTLGWPLFLLAVDTLFGSPTLALSLGTVLAVLGTYAFTRELTGERQLALVSATFMLASPLVIIQSGVFLGYLFSLGLGFLFGAALFAGLRRDSRLLLFDAGLILGWLMLTRPLDAVLWAAPFLGYAAIVYWRRWQLLARGVTFVAIGFLPLFALTLAYNHRVSGSFSQFPLTAKDPLDAFGFGRRQLMPGTKIFTYDASVAIDSTWHNLTVLPEFLFGGFLGVATAAVGLWLRRRERSTIALLLLALAFPAGYFFFWGTSLSAGFADVSGPFYFFPLYAPLCILLATAVLAAWRWRRVAGVALCFALAVSTLPYLIGQVRANHRISEAQEPWRDATRPIRNDALVFVADAGDYLLFLDPYSRNSPDLDGRIVYAVDRGPENLDLIAAHTDRQPYLELTSDPRWSDPVNHRDAPFPRVSLVPLRVLGGRSFELRVRVTSPRGQPAVVAYLQVGAQTVDRRVLATDATGGETFETTWTLAPAGSPEAAGGAVPLADRIGNISVGFASADTPDAAVAGRHVQEIFSYRLDDDRSRVNVLYPGRRYTVRPKFLGLELREVQRLRGLDVEITTNL